MKKKHSLIVALGIITLYAVSGTAIAAISNASLNGDYAFGVFGSDPYSSYAGMMDLNFDGDGNVVGPNEDEGVNRTGTYTIDPEGLINCSLYDGVSETTLFQGIVSPDGNSVVMVDTDSSVDGDVNIIMGIKKSYSMSNASLNGDYVIGCFGIDQYSAYAGTTELTFDGDGNVVGSNEDEGVDRTGTYTIDQEGLFNCSLYDGISETSLLHGIVSPDGNTVVMVDPYDSVDGDVNIIVGIKKSYSMSNASLNGEFRVVGYYVGVTSGYEDETYLVDMFFDGAGGITDIDGETIGTGTYTIDPEGLINCSLYDGVSETTLFQGIVSPDGNSVVMVDTDFSVDGDVNLVVGIKKSGTILVNISGSVTYNETPLCAMVLANGQYMFSCGDDLGFYDLKVPVDENYDITLYGFTAGFAPFKAVLKPWEALDFDINMPRAPAGSKEMEIAFQKEVGTTNPNWVRISGTVSYGWTPLCAMVLANGQNMFSCGSNLGTFDLEVPLDENGEITLHVFCSGFAPYKYVFTP